MISCTIPNIVVPKAVEKLDTISTFRGLCSPKINELKVAFTWRIPPIVSPSNIVINTFANNDPKFYKNKKLIPTANNIMITFFSFNSMFITLRNLLDSDCSTPNLRQVALSYMFILPTKYDPKIEEISNSIVM